MSAKEELLEFVSSLTQDEIEAILANFGQIVELAETVAIQEVAVR